MAQDHFKTLPGPKRGHIRPKKSKKSLKVRAKPAKQIFGKWIDHALSPWPPVEPLTARLVPLRL